MKERLRHLFFCLLIGLAAGLLYAAFCRLTGLAVPCMFYKITGLKCPSCGITRMALALLRLDVKEAWKQNRMLMAVSPLLVLLFTSMAVRYVRTGTRKLSGWMKLLTYCLIAVFCCFGVARNIVGW